MSDIFVGSPKPPSFSFWLKERKDITFSDGSFDISDNTSRVVVKELYFYLQDRDCLATEYRFSAY